MSNSKNIKFHQWSGNDSEFSNEYCQINSLSGILKKWSEETDIETHLLTNFYVGGEEIDALLIIPNNIIVIDLKSGSGTVEGQENGDWICKQDDQNQFQINPGRKNPLNQARYKRFAVINYLNKRKEEIFSSQQKAHQMSFEYTSSFIVFDGKITWDKNQLPKNVWPWFDVLSIDKLPEKIKSIRSSILSLTSEEAWTIPTLLELRNEDNIPEKLHKEDNPIISNGYADNIEENEVPYNVLGEKIINVVQDGCNPLIQCIFIGTDPENDTRLLIKTQDGKIRKVFLNDTFYAAAADLKKLASKSYQIINKEEIEINLINVEIWDNNIYLKDELQSLLVMEPAWLINVTALTEFDFCGRSLLNNRYSISNQNENMIQGSIIHEVFESILKDPADLEKRKTSLNNSFNSRILDFVLIDTDYEKMYKDFIMKHLNALSKHCKNNMNEIQDVNTERFIINPFLGLKGKIDAVIKVKNGIKAIELKTGKSYGGRVKDGHAFQAQAYTLMMEMKFEDEEILYPSVIYSGDHEKVTELQKQYNSNSISIEKGVDFTYKDKAHVMKLRNKLVLADYLFTLDYEENPNKCNKCKQASICYDLFELELEHDPKNMPIYLIESIEKKYSLEEKIFFDKYNRLLTEEYRIIKESQGEYLIKPVPERISTGRCVEINAYKELDNNEYTLYCQNESELRESDSCLLSDKKGPIFGECMEVTITKVTSKSITVKLQSALEFGPALLDSYSAETIFEKNYFALYELISKPSLTRLKNILLTNSQPIENKRIHFDDTDNRISINEKQKTCIELSLGLEDYLLIQGPPGTGKTVTISMIVDALYKQNKSMIISCYTHRAIDEVIKKINQHTPDIPIYKLGSRQIEKDLENNTLEGIINSCEGFGARLKKAKEIISEKPVYIGTTHAWLSGRYDNLLEGNLFDVAIIDEATQIVLPNVLGVIRLAKKFILVGDHRQLPPVIQSNKAKELSKTLFEILYERDYGNNNVKVMLDVQYRMSEPISKFISKEFYNDGLVTSEDAKLRKLDVDLSRSSIFEIINPDNPLTLVNVNTNPNISRMRTSPGETKVIVEIVSELLNAGVKPDDIGIIAPFRAQVADIRRGIEHSLAGLFKSSIEIKKIVDTVDRFQGDERDIVIFSLTLIDKEIPEILKDIRRLNVAISRARKKFIGVGNWELVDGNETLKNLREYAKNSNGCKFISKN